MNTTAATAIIADIHWTLKDSYLVRNYTEFSNDNCDKMFGEVARFFRGYVFLEFKIKIKQLK